ncbi:MAG TPA: aquaporin [Longimicrobium sp.]|nr:aquaporin [Longimicrobium sp.]
MAHRPARALAAEAIGTFTLCFVGILAITGGGLAGQPAGSTPLVTVALAHGLAIAVMVAALGADSGAHFNPAVTVGFVAARRMSMRLGGMYVAAQLAGALAASALLAGLFGREAVAGGTPAVSNWVSPGGAVVLEAVATFFLTLVVFGTAVDPRAPRSVYPFAIGLTVALDIIAIGPLTGAAMNPARAFGPALVAGAWGSHWVYWIGPIVGGAAGALVQNFFLRDRDIPDLTASPRAAEPTERGRRGR